MTRQLTPNDATACQSLRLRGLQEAPTAFSASYSDEAKRSASEAAARVTPAADGSQCVFGAFTGGQLAGVLAFVRSPREKLRHCAELCGMYVAPEFRRRGHGGALVEAAVAHAQSLPGIRHLKLTVNASNTAARALYQSRGFNRVAIEPDAICVDGQYYDEELYMLRFNTREVQPAREANPSSSNAPIEIKVLERGDAPILFKVAAEVFDKPVNAHLTREFLEDPRHHIAVAIDDGWVVGFASAVHYIHPDKRPELWINEVAIAPTHRRRGLGKALLSALFKAGSARDCAVAWVLTGRGNSAAMALYSSLGGIERVGDTGPGNALLGYTFALAD
jgi:ribosomal protein S18 acetylase RimI-like enzyme